MQIGFRLVVSQNGSAFTAEGEKVSENGRILPTAERTPIRATGLIDGDVVKATFVEEGSKRKTNGRFVWRIRDAGAALDGTFASTAAKTSGKSAAIKQL